MERFQALQWIWIPPFYNKRAGISTTEHGVMFEVEDMESLCRYHEYGIHHVDVPMKIVQLSSIRPGLLHGSVILESCNGQRHEISKDFFQQLVEDNLVSPIEESAYIIQEMHSFELFSLVELISPLQSGSADDKLGVPFNSNSFKELLYILHHRYNRGIYHTKVDSSFLIAFNPHKLLDSCLPSTIDDLSYVNTVKKKSNHHICRFIKHVFDKMLTTREDQSIVMNGKCRSGKSETKNTVVHYLCRLGSTDPKRHQISKRRCSKNRSDPSLCFAPALDEQFGQIADFLQSFGHNCTKVHPNQSLLVQLISIDFNKSGKIMGGHVYVPFINVKDRFQRRRLSKPSCHLEGNFHIFYQLLNTLHLMDSSTNERLGLEHMAVRDFEYLDKYIDNTSGKAKTCRDQSVIRPREHTLENIFNFLASFRVSQSDQRVVFDVLAAILHLGNIQVEDGMQGSSKFSSTFNAVCRLLQVSQESLNHFLTTSSQYSGMYLKDPREIVFHHCDQLSRYLYKALFKWLLFHINTTLGHTFDRYERSNITIETKGIHILDSFAVSWDLNNMHVPDVKIAQCYCPHVAEKSTECTSLFDFCTGYFQDKSHAFYMQNHLNRVHDDEVQSEFTRQQPHLALKLFKIRHGLEYYERVPNGLFALLDGFTQKKKWRKSDEWLQELLRLCEKETRLVDIGVASDTHGKQTPCSVGFELTHWNEKRVLYDPTTFVEDNYDNKTPSNILDLLQSSSTNMISNFCLENTIFDEGISSDDTRTSRIKMSRSSTRMSQSTATSQVTSTIGSQYKTRVSSIFEALKETNVSTILHIDPNDTWLSHMGIWSTCYVSHQLREYHVMEWIHWKQNYYSVCMDEDSFYHKYIVLCKNRSACSSLLNSLVALGILHPKAWKKKLRWIYMTWKQHHLLNEHLSQFYLYHKKRIVSFCEKHWSKDRMIYNEVGGSHLEDQDPAVKQEYGARSKLNFQSFIDKKAQPMHHQAESIVLNVAKDSEIYVRFAEIAVEQRDASTAQEFAFSSLKSVDDGGYCTEDTLKINHLKGQLERQVKEAERRKNPCALLLQGAHPDVIEQLVSKQDSKFTGSLHEIYLAYLEYMEKQSEMVQRMNAVLNNTRLLHGISKVLQDWVQLGLHMKDEPYLSGLWAQAIQALATLSVHNRLLLAAECALDTKCPSVMTDVLHLGLRQGVESHLMEQLHLCSTQDESLAKSRIDQRQDVYDMLKCACVSQDIGYLDDAIQKASDFGLAEWDTQRSQASQLRDKLVLHQRIQNELLDALISQRFDDALAIGFDPDSPVAKDFLGLELLRELDLRVTKVKEVCCQQTLADAQVIDSIRHGMLNEVAFVEAFALFSSKFTKESSYSDLKASVELSMSFILEQGHDIPPHWIRRFHHQIEGNMTHSSEPRFSLLLNAAMSCRSQLENRENAEKHIRTMLQQKNISPAQLENLLQLGQSNNASTFLMEQLVRKSRTPEGQTCTTSRNVEATATFADTLNAGDLDFHRFWRVDPDMLPLTWQSCVIDHSILTYESSPSRGQIPSHVYQVTCCYIHECILGYMKDQTTCYRPMMAQYLLQVGKSYSDEVLIQLMKQCSNNPRPQTSLRHGWSLLCMVLGSLRPSREFRPYVDHFLKTQMLSMATQLYTPTSFHEGWHSTLTVETRNIYRNYASFCVGSLQHSGSDQFNGFLPSIEEIHCFDFGMPCLTDIELVDGTILAADVPIVPYLTAREMVSMCCHTVGIQDDLALCFGIYKLVKERCSNSSAMVPMGMDELPSRYIQRCLYATDPVKFVFKIRSQPCFAYTQVDPPLFQRLMYLQTVDDVLHNYLPLLNKEAVFRLSSLAIAIDFNEDYPTTMKTGANDIKLIELLLEYVPTTWKDRFTNVEFLEEIIKRRSDWLDHDVDVVFSLETLYLAEMKKYVTFGSSFFRVKWPAEGTCNEQDGLLAVNCEGIHLTSSTGEVLKSAFISDIESVCRVPGGLLVSIQAGDSKQRKWLIKSQFEEEILELVYDIQSITTVSILKR